MRIEKLNNDKIKVTLTTRDLTSLDVKIEQLRPDSRELHLFIFKIMERIQKETGFNPYNGQIVVEAMPEKDGIAIMVSKLNNRFVNDKNRIKRIKAVRAVGIKYRTRIFYFENMDSVIGALSLAQSELLLSGKLYKAEGYYCLVVNESEKFRQSINLISEYAIHRPEMKVSRVFLKEHAKLIAEKESLRNMAEGIKGL